MIYVGIILLCIILAGAGYFFGYRSKGLMRIKYLLDVKDRFAKEGEGAKRLLVGGSDVLYSFDTDAISAKTKMRTVNFGLNVGLGMGFLLDVARKYAKPGDKIVLCLAYSLYFKPSYDIFAYEYYRMFQKRELRRFSLKQQAYYLLGNLKLNLEYKQKQFDLAKSGAYVNVQGSDFAEQKNKPLVFPDAFGSTAATKDLEQFCEECAANDIKVYVTYPSTLYFEDYKTSAYIWQLRDYLLANYNVIGEPWDYMVPREQIFNSVYHVNEQGQAQRTERLLEEIEEQEERPDARAL
ncbi:hypothetical protein HB904_10060 [Listeria booriae]|uniref:SGNH/GDSL hydrolase family protein n=1 Tax=Listeria booriae TaxID=1552123 RepID=A0A842AF64_9LIST|nr:hypothetical protein [Listeria booriae]MBC1400686.1 hypothetical protein [Listeria booriae]MBC1616533.1 hypothetical protein [Listeria booriae]